MMRGLLLRCFYALSLVASALSQSQSCYFPDGTESKNDFPCSTSSGTICCPFQWQCLDNGLCYNPTDDLIGRYTCSDQSWQSDGCPDVCKADVSLGGAEAVLSCSDGRYCCDRNRQVGNCCDWPSNNQTFFEKAAGNVFATVVSSGVAKATSLSGPSVPPLQTNSQQTSTQVSSPMTSASSAHVDTSASTSPTKIPPGSTAEVTTTLISSGADGPHTILITTIVAPSSSPISTANSTGADEDSSSSGQLGVKVGLGVGIPVALALTGFLFFFFCRRRRQNQGRRESIASSSTAPKSSRNRISRLIRPTLGGYVTAAYMLPDDIETEKLGASVAPMGITEPVEIDGRERPQPPSEIDGRPIMMPLSSHPHRQSTELEGSPVSPINPFNLQNQQQQQQRPRSWSSNSGYTQTMWRISGESDGGRGPIMPNNSPSAPKRVSRLGMLGPKGGLSPVNEEPGFNFGARTNPTSTPGGRYIPYRPPQNPTFRK